MEEVIHRDRVRKWHYHTLELLSVVAKTSGSKSILSKMADQLDLLYRMEIHAPDAYDLNTKNSTKADSSKTEDDILKMLDKIPNV
jgi:hypothetical protein